MHEEFLLFVGSWTVACATLVALTILTLVLMFAINQIGMRLFKRLSRVYSLAVVAYWLDRMEREGRRCFNRSSKAEVE